MAFWFVLLQVHHLLLRIPLYAAIDPWLRVPLQKVEEVAPVPKGRRQASSGHISVLIERKAPLEKQVGRGRHPSKRSVRDEVQRIVLGRELAGRKTYRCALAQRQLILGVSVPLRPSRESEV